MAQSLYEVHTLKGGQWVIDSTYPDRDSAIEVAKQLYGEKRFDGVKVVKDTFDPKTGEGKEIVVFDTSKAPREKTPPPPPAAKAAEAAPPAAKPAVEPRARQRYKKEHHKDISVAVKASLWLTVILIGGLGILYLIIKAGDMMGKGF